MVHQGSSINHEVPYSKSSANFFLLWKYTDASYITDQFVLEHEARFLFFFQSTQTVFHTKGLRNELLVLCSLSYNDY
jgi:hypothetical protein